MKTVLIIISLALSFNTVFAQSTIDSALLIKDSISKSAYLHQIFLVEKDNFCDGYKEIDEKIEFQNFIESYFDMFLLIANKNDTTIIFDGKTCMGHESGQVYIYKTKNNKIYKSIAQGGRISFISTNEVAIHHYPCCAMITNVISTYNLNNSKFSDSNHVFFSEYPHSDFKLVEEHRRKDASKKNIEFILEVTPRWNDKVMSNIRSESAIICDNNRTNKIGKLSKGCTGTFLAYNERKTWALIQFHSSDAAEIYCPTNFEKNMITTDSYYLYGWVEANSFKFK